MLVPVCINGRFTIFSDNDSHPSKAFEPMKDTFEKSNPFNVVNTLQPENADLPIDVNVVGRVTSVKLVHCLNAPLVLSVGCPTIEESWPRSTILVIPDS